MVQRVRAEEVGRINYSTNIGQILHSLNEIKLQKERSEKSCIFNTSLHTRTSDNSCYCKEEK